MENQWTDMENVKLYHFTWDTFHHPELALEVCSYKECVAREHFGSTEHGEMFLHLAQSPFSDEVTELACRAAADAHATVELKDQVESLNEGIQNMSALQRRRARTIYNNWAQVRRFRLYGDQDPFEGSSWEGYGVPLSRSDLMEILELSYCGAADSANDLVDRGFLRRITFRTGGYGNKVIGYVPQMEALAAQGGIDKVLPKDPPSRWYR